ncbi:hypothetical protein D3C76_1715230 [compost metagenome]
MANVVQHVADKAGNQQLAQKLLSGRQPQGAFEQNFDVIIQKAHQAIAQRSHQQDDQLFIFVREPQCGYGQSQ